MHMQLSPCKPLRIDAETIKFQVKPWVVVSYKLKINPTQNNPLKLLNITLGLYSQTYEHNNSSVAFKIWPWKTRFNLISVGTFDPYSRDEGFRDRI